jgi:predicted small metal-binding protein
LPIKLPYEELHAICVEHTLEGNSLDELCAELEEHARSVHDWDSAKTDDPDEQAKFRGAIKQTARPEGLRGLDLEV